MGRRESILIVDDDEDTRKTLAHIFGKKGYEIETAETGRQALEKAQQRFFNLALLDIRLPDIEGVELLAPLRELHPDMVMIMATANATMENAVRALNDGASAYVTKPMNMDAVLATVKDALGRQLLVWENRRLYEEVKQELAERKQAEEQLAEYRYHLEELVHERTTELGNANKRLREEIIERTQAEEKVQQLYEQERELRQQLEAEMNRRIEFTRALAHELKTPLTPMLISSQTLASELEEGPLLRLAKNVSRGACNLNSRIDELLDLAKGEIGMLRLKTNSLDMRQLLEEAIDDVAPLASSRRQSLIAELPPSLPRVQADEVRLRQIVLNLLNNALKFTPEEGKVILRARVIDGSLIVEVEDTGAGIPEEKQRWLFEPYQQLEAGGERLSGLGLGLALCKTLVELHGGQIWLESHAGKGSTFSFSLPLETAGRPAVTPETGEDYEDAAY
ncbi:MAG: ATP-binding protein [Dehalococcoidia bacterium]